MHTGPATGTGTDPAAVAARFALVGPVQGVQPYGQGNINLTYLVLCPAGAGALRRYLLQRLNPAVFADPDVVMANMALVAAHLRRRLEDEGAGDLDRRVLSAVPTRQGHLSWRDE